MGLLKYHISVKDSCLEVFFAEMKSKRAFLKDSSKEDLPVLEYLLAGVTGEASLSGVLLSASKAVKAIKLLGSTRRLYCNDKQVFFDPFSTLEFFYEGHEIGNGEYHLLGKWKLKDLTGDLKDFSFLFPSDPSFGIVRGTLQFFDRRVGSASLALTGEALDAFLLECAEEEIALHWTCAPPQKGGKKLSCTPVLILKDRKGAFADLYFDYQGTQIACHDVKKNALRDLRLEKEWEKDLLETDFVFKIHDHSHYYCPLDKVAKSLTFLLEIGWKIHDHTGRLVLRQKEHQMEMTARSSGILVQGKVSYDAYEVNLSQVIGAFNRQDQFVLLDPHHVGLVDCKEDWKELAGEEILQEGVFLKKHKVGLLSSFWNQDQVIIDKTLQLREGGAWESKPPAESFQGKLLPYQQEGLDFLLFLRGWGCSGLLADEMGLGKTVQVLAFFSHHKAGKPILIVVPTSLLFNWEREIEKFLPQASILVYSGQNRSLENALTASFILTSYTLIRQDFELLQPIDYACIVLDEGQTIKNPDSQIAGCLFQFKSEMRLILSGTPIENRWEDLWSLYHFLMPELLGDRQTFKAKMAAADVDGRYLKQLKKQVRPFLLRRLKGDVAQDLPEKISQTVLIEMTAQQRTLYEMWVQKNRSGLLKKIASDGVSSHRMEVLEAILRLRQLCAHPWLVGGEREGDLFTVSGKYQLLFSDLGEVIPEGRKVLIYSQFTEMLKLIEQGIQEKGYTYVYLDGTTKDREKVVRQFQEDPKTQVFLISLKAGGVGLNLTAADYVFLYDPWWNEAAENQAIDRAHRLGRKGAVIAKRYIMAESIEEKLLSLKKHKQSLAEGLLSLEDVVFSELTLEDLSALLA